MSLEIKQINSQFLLNLLLEENHHMNIVDFIDFNDRLLEYSCVCISLSIGEKYKKIQDCFTKTDEFMGMYFNILSEAIENFRSIVNQHPRLVFLDEAKIFHDMIFETYTINNLISNSDNKNKASDFFNVIKDNHSFAIVLRDDISFVVIHYDQDKFIIIDPHIEYCGILSMPRIFNYVTYDGTWDFDVHVIVPELSQIKNNEQSDNVNQNEIINSPVPHEEINAIEPICCIDV